MATYLLCVTPVHGHVAPLLAVAERLRARGHRIILLTGSRFADRAAELDLEFHALTGAADFDDRDPDSSLPDRDRYRGLARAQYDIQTLFVRPIPDQYAAATALIERYRPDAVLVDGLFIALGPLVMDERRRGDRPPVIALGVNPLAQPSRDVAPNGMGLAPSHSTLGTLRNVALNTLARTVLFRDTQKLAERVFLEASGVRLRSFAMDPAPYSDRFLQLCVPEFEYPRRDLSPTTRFVGPVVAGARPDEPLPEWWDELDGPRPVVHLTQGTIDNHDVTRLIRPALEALARRDVLVVVSAGGRPVDSLGALPPHALAARYLDYERLLPRTRLMITNGGYGGVQHALAHGVPLIVAGDTEDKPEVAARVRWSGAGIDLRTGSPTPEAIGRAVDRILSDGSYADRAALLRSSIARHDAFAAIEEELQSVTVP